MEAQMAMFWRLLRSRRGIYAISHSSITCPRIRSAGWTSRLLITSLNFSYQSTPYSTAYANCTRFSKYLVGHSKCLSTVPSHLFTISTKTILFFSYFSTWAHHAHENDPECQKKDWPLHKSRCKFLRNHPTGAEPRTISCGKIHSPHTRYSAVKISSEHPVFSTKVLPITAKCGYSLVVFREIEGLERGLHTDNEHAIWMNIDPYTGFAPDNWQGDIGTVVVAAADGKDLSVPVLAAITDYVNEILDAFGEGEVPTTRYSKARLDSYTTRHAAMRAEY
ncbi:hypothetical protein VTL71DRAFT_6192 [Oculimacula yallundae]|uniref:Uncharacterized protein n=1 Tax=Oculimacula yallundae TaxID=86028 RepID=A0ABR4BZM6_9HELO